MVTLVLVNCQVMCVVSTGICGESYPTREEALDRYFEVAAELDSKGMLCNSSGILN